ncbi:HIT family protein [Poriferisphaera sp. WC338]|uniref:HIT family protein n=1 Tax=Poriferisphaera sp. WC338 TaxID=3425129 RepID=UPI003D8163F1
MSNQNLWAPWRISYIKGLDDNDREQPHDSKASSHLQSGCFLCDAASHELTDQQRLDQLVILRGKDCVLMMNRYPYTNGHMMIAPHNHVPDTCDMTIEQRAEMMEMTNLAGQAVKLAMNAQGVNIGMNIGRCAGAGVPGHAHMHIVPRWHGDANFMQIVGQIRVIPQALDDSYKLLCDAVQKLLGEDRS